MSLTKISALGEILVGIVAMLFDKYQVSQCALLLAIAFMTFEIADK